MPVSCSKAFGNAKITWKFIEIVFEHRFRIVGANMRTYLLEKSRVVFQADEERSYHIFYQLCASSHLPELKALKLGCATDYQYTRQGRNPVIIGVDDAKELCTTRNAFTLLGIESLEMGLFQVLAAILHQGNVEIKEKSSRNPDSVIALNNSHLRAFCRLLGHQLSGHIPLAVRPPMHEMPFLNISMLNFLTGL